MSQLDLFERPTPCHVIVFPVARRIGRLRHCRDMYLGQPDDQNQERYWRRIYRDQFKAIKKIGGSDDLADSIANQFQEECAKAIEYELLVQSYRDEGGGRGGGDHA